MLAQPTTEFGKTGNELDKIGLTAGAGLFIEAAEESLDRGP